jgi:hypothetical protein
MASPADQALFEVLEADLRGLSAEARRTDGNLATQITGWLQHTDYGQIKESAERAALRLRAIAQDGGGLAALRETKVGRAAAAGVGGAIHGRARAACLQGRCASRERAAV